MFRKIFKSFRFYLFLFIGLSYSLIYFVLLQLSDGFSFRHIQGPYETARVASTVTPTQEISLILDQSFYYIGKGSQCYVFESEDKQYVLKFFRFPRYRSSVLSDFVTLPPFLREIEQKKRANKKHKLDSLFASCLLADKELKEETGLIYLHLEKTENLKKEVLCFDKLKRCFSVDLDSTVFLLQKKAELIYPYLTKLMEHNQKEEAKTALEDLVHLLNSRLEKGIFDSDSVITKNAGFCRGKAMFIDIGEFKKDAKYQNREIAHAELIKITAKLQRWLNQKDEDLAHFFEQQLNAKAAL